MKPRNVFLSLYAVSASALDIYFWNDRGCKGTALKCGGINPGVCCLGGGDMDLSVSYLGIVEYWHITCASSIWYNCDEIMSQSSVTGVTWVCHDDRIYDSAKYWFEGKKRDDVCTGAQRPCDAATAQRADQLVMSDGVVFNIGGLADDQWQEM